MSVKSRLASTTANSIRFVLVNDRTPRTDEHCAFCGTMIQAGYVHDYHTSSLFCDNRCFSGHTRMARPSDQKLMRNVS